MPKYSVKSEPVKFETPYPIPPPPPVLVKVRKRIRLFGRTIVIQREEWVQPRRSRRQNYCWLEAENAGLKFRGTPDNTDGYFYENN